MIAGWPSECGCEEGCLDEIKKVTSCSELDDSARSAGYADKIDRLCLLEFVGQILGATRCRGDCRTTTGHGLRSCNEERLQPTNAFRFRPTGSKIPKSKDGRHTPLTKKNIEHDSASPPVKTRSLSPVDSSSLSSDTTIDAYGKGDNQITIG